MWNSLYAFDAKPFIIYAVMLQSQNARGRQKTTSFCCRPIWLLPLSITTARIRAADVVIDVGCYAFLGPGRSGGSCS